MMKHHAFAALLLTPVVCAPVPSHAQPTPAASITIDADKPGAVVSPMLYGIFFEEINRAGDGGIYAEMVQNRSFEDANFPVAWTVVQDKGGAGAIALDKSLPLNPKNPTSLKVEITEAGGRFGIASQGFGGAPQRPRDNPEKWRGRFDQIPGGLAVEKGETYDLSLYARAATGFSGELTVSLEGGSGEVLASQKIRGLGQSWKQYNVSLAPTAPDTKARLVLSSTTVGTFWLDMVSLFPRKTWKERKNGLRPDLMEMIAAMHPAFVRFPGGCFVEGDTLENAFRWKDSIGDIAERPGHWNLWGYYSTDGLGYHEYLQMCEDLKAEPLFVANCGMSHVEQGKTNRREPVPIDPAYLQDALDAIEYANGPVSSKWGALRAKNGHPEPFNLKYLQVGNENGGPAYDERYAIFYDAIKAKYPEIQLVANVWRGVPKSRPLEIIDEHYYETPSFFSNNAHRYDTYDRKGPQIYVGEYAVTKESGKGNLQSAVGEAAFMTGMERNADIVKMASYAPLFVRPNWETWNPNAIVFDQARCYGTPSYHVQAMFGANRADQNVEVTIRQPELDSADLRGLIGLGTWNTQAEFKDIVVSQGGTRLLESDFSKGLAGWTSTRGEWQVVDGALRQTNDKVTGALILAGNADWKDYSVSLKARKLSGAEGFLITFAAPDGKTKSWWNIGGWDNTKNGIEAPGLEPSLVPAQIDTNRWYDIRIELSGKRVKCYLDGRLVHDIARATPRALFAAAGTDKETGELIFKVVNTSNQPMETAIKLNGIASGPLQGTLQYLTGHAPREENTFDAPNWIAPHSEPFKKEGPAFDHTFPANSVSIVRVKTK